MTGVDHVIFAVPDLDAGCDHIERALGVRPVTGGRHPRWATRNAVLGLGSRTYLEVIAPDPEAAGVTSTRPFGIDSLDSMRLAGWAAPANDLEGRVERAATRGLDLGPVIGGSRSLPDGTELTWKLTDPMIRLHDGIVPFLIDWTDSRHPSVGAPQAGTLSRLRARHPEPDAVARALAALGVELEIEHADRPALIATIAGPNGIVEMR
jgi:hypothetical protein